MPLVVIRGFGSIGSRHARVAQSLGCHVSVWPVRSTDRGFPAGIKVLDDHTGPDVSRSADLVILATDTGRHVDDALRMLDFGARRLLIEKPVASTHHQALRLVGHRRADHVWVAAPLRATEAMRHVIKALPALGAQVSAHVWSQSWLPDWRPDRDYRQSYSADPAQGGVLRDLVHELDYIAVLFGAPELVGATLEHVGPLDIAAEQAATFLLRTPLASAVTVRLDYVTRPATRGITIRGADGEIRWSATEQRVDMVDFTGSTQSITFSADADRDAPMAVQLRAAMELSPSTDQADLRASGAPATLSEGVATIRLCDEARAWADNEQPRVATSKESP